MTSDEIEAFLRGASPEVRALVLRGLAEAPPLTQQQIDAIHSLMRSDGPPRPPRGTGRASGGT